MFEVLSIALSRFTYNVLVMEFLRSLASNAEEFMQGIFDTERFINWGRDYALSLPYFAQLGGLVLLGIVVIMGVFGLLKALTKVIIVLAILIGVGILFQQGVFGG